MAEKIGGVNGTSAIRGIGTDTLHQQCFQPNRACDARARGIRRMGYGLSVSVHYVAAARYGLKGLASLFRSTLGIKGHNRHSRDNRSGTYHRHVASGYDVLTDEREFKTNEFNVN